MKRNKDKREEKREVAKIRETDDESLILELGASSKHEYVKLVALNTVGERKTAEWLNRQGLDKNNDMQLMAINGLDKDIDAERQLLMNFAENGCGEQVRKRACASLGHSWRLSDGICEICSEKLKLRYFADSAGGTSAAPDYKKDEKTLVLNTDPGRLAGMGIRDREMIRRYVETVDTLVLNSRVFTVSHMAKGIFESVSKSVKIPVDNVCNQWSNGSCCCEYPEACHDGYIIKTVTEEIRVGTYYEHKAAGLNGIYAENTDTLALLCQLMLAAEARAQ